MLNVNMKNKHLFALHKCAISFCECYCFRKKQILFAHFSEPFQDSTNINKFTLQFNLKNREAIYFLVNIPQIKGGMVDHKRRLVFSAFHTNIYRKTAF